VMQASVHGSDTQVRDMGLAKQTLWDVLRQVFILPHQVNPCRLTHRLTSQSLMLACLTGSMQA
jgi:hypothetical protein